MTGSETHAGALGATTGGPGREQALKVVMAGGGTAGHVNPLLATADALRAHGAEVRALGTREGLEAELLAEAGIEMITIPRAPFPRRPNLDALKFPGRWRRALAIAKEAVAGADAVIGFGGYVAAPLYAAAKACSVPVIIHEQNALPGLANRAAARIAAGVGLTFASTPLRARTGITRVTGLPLRPAIAQVALERRDPDKLAKARRAGAQRLGLDPEKTIALVTGGSLGAQHLNEAMVACAAELTENAQILHLTGKGKDGPVRAALAKSPVEVRERYQVREYLSEMEDALACADLVISRAGAGMVAEIGAVGIAAVFIPLPIGNGEQAKNAADIVHIGGASMIADADLTPERVRREIVTLLGDRQRLEAAGKLAARISPINGAQQLAELTREIAAGGKP